jgi:hypothetical protein
MAKYYSDKSDFGSYQYEEVAAVSDKPNVRGEHHIAKMTVRHKPAEERENFNQLLNPTGKTRTPTEQKVYDATGYDYDDLKGNTAWEHNYAVRSAQEIEKYKEHSATNITSKYWRRRNGIDYAKSVREIHKGTSQMFTPDPASTTVGGAFSHSTMRHSVPMMASYLHQKYGSLTADADLSEHSVRMTEHAEKLGLPVTRHHDNEDLDVTNSYDFDDEDLTIPAKTLRSEGTFSDWTQIPDSTMKSAKQHYRELRGIGRNTPKPLSSQFNQPQLPGMEDK